MGTQLIDDGGKRDRGGRRLTARIRREELLREYDESGLTQVEFARRAGVKYPTFTNWVQARRTGAGCRGKRSVPVRFAEVSLPTTGVAVASLSVALPGGLIVRGGDIAQLAALVRALQEGERC